MAFKGDNPPLKLDFMCKSYFNVSFIINHGSHFVNELNNMKYNDTQHAAMDLL